ncbi:Hydroxyisourate hydrolase [Hordeum vulgare]|nr:Hydroxyisourate hydrolase [Hordeum vulgare]
MVKGANNIKLFRRITLINVPFKLCARAYATRLAPIAQRVILQSETAFLKGLNILEGPIALLEIVHELKRTKRNGVLLKLDFEKAYDQVNWEFIREMLLKKGFEAGFSHRIMHLVSCGQRAVMINSEVGKFFRKRRGLREGDPSSPFILNFIADALSAMLAKDWAAGHIKGLVPHLIPWG